MTVRQKGQHMANSNILYMAYSHILVAVGRRTSQAKREWMNACQKRPRYAKRDLGKKPRKETCRHEKKESSSKAWMYVYMSKETQISEKRPIKQTKKRDLQPFEEGLVKNFYPLMKDCKADFWRFFLGIFPSEIFSPLKFSNSVDSDKNNLNSQLYSPDLLEYANRLNEHTWCSRFKMKKSAHFIKESEIHQIQNIKFLGANSN